MDLGFWTCPPLVDWGFGTCPPLVDWGLKIQIEDEGRMDGLGAQQFTVG